MRALTANSSSVEEVYDFNDQFLVMFEMVVCCRLALHMNYPMKRG